MGIKTQMRASGPNWVHWPSQISIPPQGPKGGARLTQLFQERTRWGRSSPPSRRLLWMGKKGRPFTDQRPPKGWATGPPFSPGGEGACFRGHLFWLQVPNGAASQTKLPPSLPSISALFTSLTSGFHFRDYWGEPSSGPGCHQEAEGLGPCPTPPRGPRSTPRSQLNRGHGDARPVWRD